MGYFRITRTFGRGFFNTLSTYSHLKTIRKKVKWFLFYRWWNWKSKNQIVPFKPRTMEFKKHSPNSWGFLFSGRCTTKKLILRPTSLLGTLKQMQVMKWLAWGKSEWVDGSIYDVLEQEWETMANSMYRLRFGLYRKVVLLLLKFQNWF